DDLAAERLELDLARQQLSLYSHPVTGSAPQPVLGAVAPGEWHLVELDMSDNGGAGNVHTAWLDGAAPASQACPSQGKGTLSLRVGEAYEDNAAFEAVLDFDDVRLSTAPQASTLTVDAADGG